MNRPPWPTLFRVCAYCIPLIFLSASALHAQIGGGSETLYQFDGAQSTDRFGQVVANAGDLNNDGIGDFLIAAPEESPASSYHAGTVSAYSGADGSLLHQWFGLADLDYLGQSLSAAGDVNGDGFDDVIVGAHRADPGGLSGAGSAYVYSGADGSLLYQWDGAAQYDYFGQSVAGAGDVNADGFDDVLVGSPRAANPLTNNTGAAFVFSGADGSILFSFYGTWSGDRFGQQVSASGDLNADGIHDFLIRGVAFPPASITEYPAVFAYSGVDGSLLHTFYGEGHSTNFGTALSHAGDVDADGYGDVIIGDDSDFGGVSPAGSAFVYSGFTGTLLHRFDGLRQGQGFGYSVSGPGDLNADGFDDLLISAYDMGSSSLSIPGSVSLYSGRDGVLLYSWHGSAGDDEFGISCAGAGDINQDGRPEVIIGAAGAGQIFAPPEGRAFVFSFEPFLSASGFSASTSQSTTIQFDFDFPNAASFHQYKLLMTASGVGSTFYGVDIPLTMDRLLVRSFLGNYPVSTYSNLHGTLDLFGDASGSLTLPAGINPSLIGTTYHCAAISNAPGQLPSFSSIALSLTITL